MSERPADGPAQDDRPSADDQGGHRAAGAAASAAVECGSGVIYFDYNATTPVDPGVLEAMLPWFTRRSGNASSTHLAGRRAAAAVAQAREEVAVALGAPPSAVIFTSGATEADNLAILGVHGPVVVSATEHKAVLEPAQARQCRVVRVLRDGRVDLDALEAAARGAALISVMLANNETGILQDIPAIAEVAQRSGCLLHTDATQAFGKIAISVEDLGVDLLSLSAHKVYGPQGVGALFVRRGVRLRSIAHGGGHERGLRPGTLNVPGIVGLGAAASVIDPEADATRARRQLGVLEEHLRSIGDVEFISDHRVGLPNTMSVRFVGADAEAVLANAPTVAASTGSACTAAVPEPSHVLRAMGIGDQAAYEVIRLSIGRPTTDTDVSSAASALAAATEFVRAAASAPDVQARTAG